MGNYTEANNPNNVSQQTRQEWAEDREKFRGRARAAYENYMGRYKSTEAGNRRAGLLILICIFILWGEEGATTHIVSRRGERGPPSFLRGGERRFS